METTLIETIRKSWENDSMDYEPKENEFRISSIAYCDRRLYYDKTETKEESNNTTNKYNGIFSIGRAIHEYIQQKLPVDYLIACEKEITFDYQDITLIGHYDMLIFDREVGLKVVDIKSANSRAFNYRLQEASEHHKVQGNTYAAILNVGLYSILYIDKNDFSMVEHEYLTDKELFEETLIKAKNIYLKVLKENIPDRIAKSWECNYCPFVAKCRGD